MLLGMRDLFPVFPGAAGAGVVMMAPAVGPSRSR
jgi:hypothetical protein